MAMIENLRRWVGLPERTVFRPFNIDMLAGLLSSYDALGYPTIRQTLHGEVEEISPNFSGLAMGGFKRNGIIFTCMATRQLLFSEARFQFQQLRGGRPGDLFGNQDLALLENPWPNATTGDLLSRAIQDVDLAGNFFAVRRPGRIRRLRPDWMSIILGSENDVDTVSTDIDAEVIGYAYHPGGYDSGDDPVVLMPREVAHWAPIPDPEAGYRGISWIEAVRREITGDSAARDHKLKFFENGATPNMVVSLNLDDPDKFKRLVETMDTEYKGLQNAYKTLYLAAGATATPVGSDFQQLDLKGITGAGEVRIINASGMHATIIGSSEGLQGSSLNSGNFTAARRLVADKTLRPLWRGFAGAMQTIIPTPGDARLWYDAAHIPFLQDDVKDAAAVQAQQSSAIRQLVDAGFEAESVIDAITAGDFKRLNHSGLMSVQLLPPGTTAKPSSNGSEPIPEPAAN
jgi:hypothetical protein